jgi:hypothetical protein
LGMSGYGQSILFKGLSCLCESSYCKTGFNHPNCSMLMQVHGMPQNGEYLSPKGRGMRLGYKPRRTRHKAVPPQVTCTHAPSCQLTTHGTVFFCLWDLLYNLASLHGHPAYCTILVLMGAACFSRTMAQNCSCSAQQLQLQFDIAAASRATSRVLRSCRSCSRRRSWFCQMLRQPAHSEHTCSKSATRVSI